ncbi:hypothetical protein R6Z07F_016078 [Ovis aries]
MCVRSLVQENPTCRGATEPVCTSAEAVLCNERGRRSEKPCTQLERSSCAPQLERSPHSGKAPAQPKSYQKIGNAHLDLQTGILESFPRAQRASLLISALHSSRAVLKGSGFSHQRPSRERSQNRSIQVKDGGDQPPKPALWRDSFHPACSNFNRSRHTILWGTQEEHGQLARDPRITRTEQERPLLSLENALALVTHRSPRPTVPPHLFFQPASPHSELRAMVPSTAQGPVGDVPTAFSTSEEQPQAGAQNWGGISLKEERPLTSQYRISLHSSSKLPFSVQIHELAAQPGSLKPEEAKKMPSVLCPSPAREPGYLVAVGLPFPKQPSVVTSLSAEPDSSLVSASFQSVPCAQSDKKQHRAADRSLEL